ncbi:hypothetical protein AAVH_27374 [Aphelenchoides avenae]|nr:hypothetical protein AAVH_27374 [Aphelenchus avenae]
MLPAEVLEHILLLHTRQMLDKLICVNSSFANVILTDAFDTQSPLRPLNRIILGSPQEIIIIVPKAGGGQRELRGPLSEDTVNCVRLCFFHEIALTARVPELLQWVCANQAVLHAENLTVRSPLASLELFHMHCFKHVAFVSDQDCQDHVGPRQRISLQCDLLRDCETLNLNYGLSGYANAVADFVFGIEDIALWLHRPMTNAVTDMDNYRLVLDMKHLDGDLVRLVEMLEEHAVNAALPVVAYRFMVGPLRPATTERIAQMRPRRFNRTTGEYFEVRPMEGELIVSRRKLF